MQITFLGSGGAFCDYRANYHNNALVETAAGPVLLDCGTTACQSLRELGVAPQSIAAVLFTHLHADHASPEQLIWERTYTGAAEGAPPSFLRTPLCGPDDLLRPLGAALHPFLDIWSDERGEVRAGGLDALVELRTGAVHEIGGLRFRWFRVPHVRGPAADKPAYGVEIDDGHTVVYWSGDTTLSPEWLAAAAAHPRLGGIFHECSFSAPFRGTVHTHFTELEGLSAELRSRVTLMHHTAVPPGVELGPLAGAAARHSVHRLRAP